MYPKLGSYCSVYVAFLSFPAGTSLITRFVLLYYRSEREQILRMTRQPQQGTVGLGTSLGLLIS